MVSQKVIITDEKGLHMRPAKDLSQIAVSSNSKVKIKVNDCEYNAKSLIGVLGAGIKNGCEIELICEGEDEEDTLLKMVNYLTTDSTKQ